MVTLSFKVSGGEERKVRVRDCRLFEIIPSMPNLALDQENQVCEGLIKLGWLETEQALHIEGVRAVRDVLQCSTDDAKAILGDLRSRKLVDLEITPDGHLDARRPTPPAQWRWIRPTTSH
jgi:hypothetical protein